MKLESANVTLRLHVLCSFVFISHLPVHLIRMPVHLIRMNVTVVNGA